MNIKSISIDGLRIYIAEEACEPAVTVESGGIRRLVLHSVAGADPLGVVGDGGVDQQEHL